MSIHAQVCTGPRAPDHQIVSTVRSLDGTVPPILNQLASVFPARLKLFGTNGPVALAAAIQNDYTAKNKHLDKLLSVILKRIGETCIYVQQILTCWPCVEFSLKSLSLDEGLSCCCFSLSLLV